MFDLFHLPDSQMNNTRVFGPIQARGTTSGWQVWTKPRGCTMLSIIAVSSGGGGGGGAGNIAGSAKGGGGGGGASTITRALFPLWAVPDNLYISVSCGALGGAGGSTGSGVDGGFGQQSYVSIYPNTNVNNLLISSHSGASPISGGGAGTIAAAGSGGGGGAGNSQASMVLSCWAIAVTVTSGSSGANGGAQTGAVGANVSIGNAGMIQPGAGGAGSQSANFAGGDISALANTVFPVSPGGAAGSNAGSDGFRFGQIPIFYGGAGGGSSNSTTGGAGGSAASSPGAGGGGGGAGTPTGGRGGDGGPGMVILTCF